MRIAVATLGFIYTAVLAALGLGFALQGLSPAVGWISLILGAGGATLLGRAVKAADPLPLKFWDWAVLGVFALASLRAFLWLIFLTGDEIRVLSPNNLGDMSLHLNFIRNFASGVPLWPENPILSGVPLTYPLGADLLNSILEVCGFDTVRGLVWVGLMGAALTGYALWRWGGAFGVAAFLFNGGLAGFAALRTWLMTDFQQELTWKNLFLAMFVTQRGLLVALPAGLLLLYAWRERWFRSGRQLLPVWVQILFYAAMPIFNIHAFLFLSLTLLAIFCARKPARMPLIKLVGMAFVPATMGMLLVTGKFSAASGLRWAPGWVWGDTNWAEFFSSWGPGFLAELILPWAWNFGLTLPLMVILGVVLFYRKDAEARCFVWMALLVFAACCVVAFAPWAWDNMKLIMWSWLVVAPYIWTRLLRPLAWPAQAAVCFALFFSGAVSLCGGLDRREGYVIGYRSELAGWQYATRDIPATSRFACVPDYNHPLILIGRRVACGYEGHLWSHGLAFREKLDLLKESFDGRISWSESAPELGVDWLGLRPRDLALVIPPGEAPRTTDFGALYDLRLLKRDRSNQSPPQLPRQSVDLSW